MAMVDTIRAKLSQAFLPSELEITDESAKHAGHSGAREGGESHFHVYIVSDAFTPHNRVARQRLIMSCLADELASQIHALSIKALTPSELERLG